MTSTLHPVVPGLPELVDHWVEEGLVSPEQAERLLADAAEERERSGPSSLLVEAFAYLGGIVVLVAAGVLAGRYWEDLGIGGRLGLVGFCAVVLLAAGAAVPERLGGAAARLRQVLWVLATGAVALLLGLAANERDSWSGEDVALVAAAGTSVVAFVLWRRNRAVLQHVALFAALMSTTGTAAAHLDVEEATGNGLALWLTAAAWLLLSWRGLLDVRRVGYVVGSLGLVLGALVTTDQDWGIFFALATAGAIVVAAVLQSDLILLGIGAIGILQDLPRLVERYFPGGAAGPLLLLVVGGLLLAAAFQLSRRQGTTRRRRGT